MTAAPMLDKLTEYAVNYFRDFVKPARRFQEDRGLPSFQMLGGRALRSRLVHQILHEVRGHQPLALRPLQHVPKGREVLPLSS